MRKSIPSARLLRTMNQLIEVYGVPNVIRAENGTEMTSEAFIEWENEMSIELLYIQPGRLNQNAFDERYICLNQSQRLKRPLMRW